MKRTASLIGVAVGFFVILVALGTLASFIFKRATSESEDALLVDKNTRPQEKPKFIIVCEEWAPFEYLEEGKPVGIDVDVLDHIFGKLNVDYEIQFYPWARAWWLAQNGKADAVLSISYKKDREKHLLYTESQKEFGRTGKWPTESLWNARYVFFCGKTQKTKLNFDSYAQIRADGYRLVTIREYSYNKEFRDARLPSITVPDQDEAFKVLAAGQVDLFPNELTVGRAALKKLGLSSEITNLDKPMFTKPYLMPFCRKSSYPEKEKIMLRFYAELNRLRSNGKYQEIYLKYTEPSTGASSRAR